jgi:hypothetical protein
MPSCNDDYTATCTPRFRSGNYDTNAQAKAYLRDLMQLENRNMERIVEVVPETDSQVLQNLLPHSSWDHRGVMAQVTKDIDD